MRALLAPVMLADERAHEDGDHEREERQAEDCLDGKHLDDHARNGVEVHDPVIARHQGGVPGP
jgi:hypothetical protein